MKNENKNFNIEKILEKDDFDFVFKIINHTFNIDNMFKKTNPDDKYFLRKRPYPDARFVFAKLLMIVYNNSLKVGKKMNLDHSTVLHAIKQFDSLIKTDKEFKSKYNEILIRIEAIKLDTINLGFSELFTVIENLKKDNEIFNRKINNLEETVINLNNMMNEF